jgi:hypothetical protein
MATDNRAAGGTFLSLIPLLTEVKPHFYISSIPLHHANLPVILWVILEPHQKRHYQQLKNNNGCLSTGLPP